VRRQDLGNPSGLLQYTSSSRHSRKKPAPRSRLTVVPTELVPAIDLSKSDESLKIGLNQDVTLYLQWKPVQIAQTVFHVAVVVFVALRNTLGDVVVEGLAVSDVAARRAAKASVVIFHLMQERCRPLGCLALVGIRRPKARKL
jgi:hypothetical protein